ncbi:MAG: hypothetical protein ACI9A1_001220, partial [Lentimonas sp.]
LIGISGRRERSQFKLTYEREISGIVHREEKTIIIELGQRLFNADSVFDKDGQPAANLPICIGLSTHDGKAESFSNTEKGGIATWESLDDSELGTEAYIAPERRDEIKVVHSEKKEQSHISLISETDSEGKLSD